MDKIFYIFTYSSILSILIPIFFLIRKKETFKIKVIAVLGLLLFASAFSDFLSLLIVKMGKSNIVVTNIYYVAEFFLLSYIYYILLKKKKLIYAGLILFISFFIINTLCIQSINDQQSWARGLGSIILIVYSIIYFLQLLDEMPTKPFRFSSLWINMAVFYYFGATFLIFFSTNYIFKTESAEFGMLFWSFHNINNIIKNILFAIAISYAGVKHEIIKDEFIALKK